ncbi:MAG TPA: integrase arm-type DNA-binding domain-containing protein [Xanthobacteraceae bacterium]|nr:integrase arm-type DNA-binding domain-containing protein [Xanthobacteraceae bacterium]
MDLEGKTTRAKRVRFTPAVIEMKAPKEDRIERRDDLSPLWLRVTPSGDRSFAVRVRIGGKGDPVRLTFPEPAHVSNLTAAREWALKTYSAAKAGIDPREAKRVQAASAEAERLGQEQHAFETVAATFLATGGVFKVGAKGWKPRTADTYARTINKRLVPKWKGRAIHSITKDEIADFLAEVVEVAPIAANRALQVLSALMNWYQRERGSNFRSPIVKGMAPAQEVVRDRILDHDEIRAVWAVAKRAGTFGGIVRTLLLTAARKGEVGAMRHSQIDGNGLWVLPGDRVKNSTTLELPLPAEALAIIAAQDRTDEQDIVFSIGGECEFKNWGHSKAEFDKLVAKEMGAPVPNWTLHDLRRTARSLMSDAEVPFEDAERVLNHTLPGLGGTYDRSKALARKGKALRALARLLHQIVDGEPAGKVVPFKQAAE